MLPGKRLKLRPGEWVEVRGKEEVLASLDAEGSLDAVPFMPEMLRYCGQKFQVYRRADKTCDTIDMTGGRQLDDTVHLSGLRCDGSEHGGCEASCLMFWKEAWLKRIDSNQVPQDVVRSGDQSPRVECTEQDVMRCATVAGQTGIYRCQATELKRFTRPLAWWDVRQYVRDVRTNGVAVSAIASSFLFAAYRKVVEMGVGYRFLIAAFDWFQRIRGGTPYPYKAGQCESTPTGKLGLQVGELVRVKTYEQILETLDPGNRNRGLYFDAEMVKFCRNIYRVAKVVHRIIDEKTGRMLEFRNSCIILQDVYCRADVSKYRLFCPRSIFPYWREIWLERVDERRDE